MLIPVLLFIVGLLCLIKGGFQQSCHEEAEKTPASKNAKPIKKFSMAHLTPCRCRAASGRLPSG